MELENLVMAELETMDLNGVKVINLSCRDEATDISFEIDGMKIDFTATSESDFQVIALTHGDTVYTDEATLSKCNEWVKYVFAVVNPVIGKHRAELAEIPSTANFDELKVDEQVDEQSVVVTSNVSNERIEEAADRGRKEGYKAARRKNIQEIKKVKRKYRIMLILIIIILIGGFIALFYFYQSGDINLPNLPGIF